MKLPDLHLILHCHCEKATQLASESQERELTFSERWALRLHTLICKSCRRALRQLQQLRRAVASLPDSVKRSIGKDTCELSPAAKARIAEALRESDRN